MKVDDEGIIKMLNPILPSENIYEALSFMGCSCGLCYAEWSRNDKNENHAQRLKDVQDFANYLDTHKLNNEIRIFSTMWEEFPDKYEQRDFKTSEIKPDEFYMDEMIILKVV